VTAVSAALEAGALTELPVHRFPLEECAAAHEAVQSGAVGKVLLKVG
jgi:NADPH2:quinone reductase